MNWLTVVCASLHVVLCSNLAFPAAQNRPNIVVILCDDLGYADVGFNGARDIRTPSIDRLARSGTVFSSAYVCHPFCGPSRMGLMTGRYPHAFGAPYNLPPSGLGIEQYADEGIPTSEMLISSVLQQSGYYTGAIGKWHMGFAPQFHPNARGFDDFFGFLGGGHMYFPERYGPIYERQKANGIEHFNEYITPLEHNGQQVSELDYMTDALSREAVRFVNEAAAKDQPFFLYLAYNAPHTPLEAREEDLARFTDITDEKRRTYAAMVYAVDRGVDRLVDALRAAGEFENTLIVFLSDNGGKIGAGADNGPLKQGKGSICEGGIRVPMFWHWPDAVPAGQRFDHPVTALDFYPTFAGLAGAAIPTDKRLDGKDIWDAFKANRSPHAGESIFSLRHFDGFHNAGIRQDQWKATKLGPNSPWGLFNLADDIGESYDVSTEHPDLVREMVAAAQNWSESHVQPRWFDNLNAEENWQAQGMPDYERTFLIDGPRDREQTHTSQAAMPFGGVLAAIPGVWELVPTHSDEFDGDDIDTGKWDVDPEDWGVWSWEPSNVRQTDGALQLTMRHATHSRGKLTLDYTSGIAKTRKTITYGYFEARVRGCSRYPGACPAFWLYSRGPTNRYQARDGETVSYSEIDIVELQQSEYDFERRQHFPVNRMDCNLHAVLIRNGQEHWVRPHSDPEMCKTAYDASWDPRDDYHVYAVLNTPEEIIWFIDGKEVGRKPNLYWHLPMHLTLSLGLRHPFVKYQDGKMVSVPEAKTDEGFPTSMAVDYVRIWQRPEDAKPRAVTDWTLAEYVAREKVKWDQNGWPWNQDRVESNFREIDTNNDGLASGEERQKWFQKKAEESK